MNAKQFSVTGARQGRDSAATGLGSRGHPEKTGFPFDQGLYVDPNNSKLFVTEDATAGIRSGRGHVWVFPFTP